MKAFRENLAEAVYQYRNYLCAAFLLVAMLVGVGAANAPKSDVPMTDVDLSSDDEGENFEIDAYDDINRLIENYFTAYTAGDIATLEKIVRPLTETEKSYIEVYSGYVEGCENIVCYTKSGLDDGEYIVSVYLDMMFKGVDTTAPGLDFFYVETDADGNLYIDNVYSQFNQSNQEENPDLEVESLIAEFQNSEDMEKLKGEVQSRYEKAVSSDAKLKTMVEETVPNAITVWANNLALIAKEQNDSEPVAESENSGENGEPATDGETGENGEPASDAETGENEAENQTDDTEGTAGDTENESEHEIETNSGTKMYVITDIKLRKEPSTRAEVLTLIEKGERLKAFIDTLDDDGWVEVEYGEQMGFVKREYLVRKKASIPSDEPAANTEQTTVTALPEGTEVTLTQNVNLRKAMSEDAEKMATVESGQTVKVVMSYAEGWTKVEWNEKIGYMRTDLIK